MPWWGVVLIAAGCIAVGGVGSPLLILLLIRRGLNRGIR